MNNVLSSLNEALHKSMEQEPCVVLIGEDILDPYGGAFKVTKGLSSRFPDRVFTSPISEAGIVGMAAGMAVRGLRPVVEIMFGDFLSLAADQILNHAAKFRWMYNDQVKVPMVIRTPMGGRRGYGPTHSQTLEKMFLGIPGLTTLVASDLGNPGQLLLNAILKTEDPVLFIENKLLYNLPLQNNTTLPDFDVSETGDDVPNYTLTIRGAPKPVLTIAAYGYMASAAREAVKKLAYEREIFCELCVPTRLSPIDISSILASTKRTGRLLTVEEGGLSFGWGAEVAAQATEKSRSAVKISRLGALDLPVPASLPLENSVLPSVEDIYHAAEKIVII